MSEISSRIDNALTQKQITRAELSRQTGIPVTTIKSWISGAIPNAEAAYKVAQYLGVTVEWLVTGTASEQPVIEKYSDQERELIDIFRHLDERDKNAVITLAQSLESQYSNTSAKNSTAG